jgi:signal transduction histidine kinase
VTIHRQPQTDLLDVLIDVSAPASSSGALDKICGSGEMADLTRAFDWSHTPVGPVDQWPEALLITVNTMLNSRHPMFLWWGPDLIQFYNDAYRPCIREDKHPSALGQRGAKCWSEIWHIIGPQIESVMSRGEATWHENQLIPILRNGSLEDVYWTYGYSPVRLSDGKIAGTLVVCTETTQSVMAKRQLLQEQQRLFDLFQQAPAFFTVLDGPNFIFEMTNPPYQDLIGQRAIIGKSVLEAIPEAESQGFIGLLQKVYATGVPYIGRGTPIQLARSAGLPLEMRYIDFVYQPRREADGTISGIIVLGVDVTESKRAEQVLLQSEKLNAVGRLASSIAHEINNPLEAVTNLIYLAQQAAIEPQARQYLDMAETELGRVAAIANQTLRFYRQANNPKPITAEQIISDTLPLYRGRLANSKAIIERRDRGTRLITCFDGEIRQVLSNLLANGIDALHGNGGRLLIRSRDGVHHKTGRKGVILTLADTGAGMAPATASRIFEPFYTTKGLTGTGLGLWISKEIIGRHHGAIKVRSCQSPAHSGTVFTVFLPSDGPNTIGPRPAASTPITNPS